MIDLPAIAAKWGANGQVQLIAERENAVYKILRDGTPMAMRLHRAGYQSETSILSELRWMPISAIGRWTLCLCNYLGRGRADRGYGQPH